MTSAHHQPLTGQPSIHRPSTLDLERLLPHRPPLRLVRSVVKRLDDGIVCSGWIPHESPLAFPAGASPFLGIELAAQAAAVHEGLRASEADDAPSAQPRIGYLAAIRKAKFHVPLLPLDELLLATIQEAGKMANLAMFQVTVRLPEQEEPLLTATLSTMLAPA